MGGWWERLFVVNQEGATLCVCVLLCFIKNFVLSFLKTDP